MTSKIPDARLEDAVAFGRHFPAIDGLPPGSRPGFSVTAEGEWLFDLDDLASELLAARAALRGILARQPRPDSDGFCPWCDYRMGAPGPHFESCPIDAARACLPE